MKRPKLEYAENCTLIHTYARKLEEYCDELEAIVSKGDYVTHYEKKIERLEKALDKACFELMYYQERLFTLQKTITELGRCYYTEKDIEARNANEWIEWLMKDE